MKSYRIIAIVICILAALFCVAALASCTDDAQTPGSSQSTQSTLPPQSSAPADSGDDNVEKVIVDFRPGDGAVVVSGETTIKVPKDSKLTADMFPTVTKEGYVLKGWSFTLQGTDPWSENRKITNQTVLFAIWEAADGSDAEEEKVTITFEPRGGEMVGGVNTIEVKKGAYISFEDMPVAVRSGYTFKCWAYDRAGIAPWNDEESIDEDMTLYAQWTEGESAAKVTITFQKRGGTIVEGEETVVIEKGGKITLSKAPKLEKSGYVLAGWTYDVEGENSWNEDDTFTEDKTLYAKWVEPSDITITFEKRGGTIIDGEETVTIAAGGKITLLIAPEVERTGYVFAGWTYDRAGKEPWDKDDVFVEDTTLYAKWEEKSGDSSSSTTGSSGTDKPQGGKVTITFSLRGGTIIDGKETVTITSGGKITVDMTPEVERSGYTFKCWTYDRTGASVWNANQTFTKDTYLYAQWEEKSTTDSSDQGGQAPVDPSGKVTISYETGSGYFENDDDWEKVIESGTRVPLHPTPVNDNPALKFDGWFTDDKFTSQVSNSTKYTADTTLYAKWSEMTKCLDGSYDHYWTAWDTDRLPTCTEPGLAAQYCQTCNAKNTMTGDPATGHKWREWEEGFLKRQRTCGALGCGAEQYQEFENITISTLGTDPDKQIKIFMSEGGWGYGRAACLVNGNWDEPASATFCGKGGEVSVTINLETPSKMDRIYVKGHGAGFAFNVYVQYEGESEYTLVGASSFLSYAQDADKENRVIPFASVDNTTNIVSVKVVVPNSSHGEDYWDEIAFVTIPPIQK